MTEGTIEYSSMPYRKFSQIRIKNSEPFTSDYLNAHIVRLCANLESLHETNTLQKAGYDQWGTVRKATENDFLNPSIDSGTAVITNDVVNRVICSLRDENAKQLFINSALTISKHCLLKRGSFVVASNTKVAKKITTNPDSVLYTKLNIVPVGYERKPFYTTNVVKTDNESFKNCESKNVGVIEFESSEQPVNYDLFSIYYHQSGYVICDTGMAMTGYEQFCVNWIQLICNN